MSTHINGYKINVKDMASLNNFFAKLRKNIKEKQRDYFLNYLAKSATRFLDSKEFGEDRLIEGRYSRECSLISALYDEFNFNYKQIYMTQMRNSEYDIGFSITWFYYRKEFYAVVYSDMRELSKVWEELPEVEEYLYWNNTDGMNSVSRRDWLARGRKWNKIIPSSIPARHGYSIDMKPDLFELMNYKKDLDIVLKKQPTYKERVGFLTEKLYVNYRMEQLKDEGDSRYYTQYSKIYKEIKDNKKLEKKWNNKVKERLKRKYSKKDFLTKVNIKKGDI